MGTRGRDIVGKNVDNIILLLKKAFCDEWLAYHQYWIGAKVIKGPMKDAVIAELLQHAADELRHSEMIADRIIQLGGTPPINPKSWFELTNCGYDEPSDEFVKTILEQNIKGEQCAIDTYNALLGATKEDDFVTYNIIMEILTDEIEHEEDLQALDEDLDLIFRFNK